MSLSGSWARRPFSWFASRTADATTFGRRATSDGFRFRARTMTRDFKLWEIEIDTVSADSTTTDPGTTVSGNAVLDLSVGHRPIEEIAAHLRRLRSAIDCMPPDVSFIRWEGVTRAYDDYLWLACRELDVPTDLITIGFGRHRDEERCRLETLLGEAGLPVR